MKDKIDPKKIKHIKLRRVKTTYSADGSPLPPEKLNDSTPENPGMHVQMRLKPSQQRPSGKRSPEQPSKNPSDTKESDGA